MTDKPAEQYTVSVYRWPLETVLEKMIGRALGPDEVIATEGTEVTVTSNRVSYDRTLTVTVEKGRPVPDRNEPAWMNDES